MRIRTMALVVCATGCVSSAQLTLDKPVRARCVSAGLQGCEQLTRGTVLYADGRAQLGQQALTAGLDANAGRKAELEAFATSLRSLDDSPQTTEYSVRLQPAIDLILEAAGKGHAAAAPPPVAAASAPAPARPQAPSQPSESGAAPSAEPGSEPSDAGSPSSKRVLSGFIGGHADETGQTNIVPCRLGDGTPGWCIFQPIMIRGIITDLVVSPACERDVFVLEGSPARPSWLVWSSANKGLSMHDLRLPVQSGGSLVVGIVTKGTAGASQWFWRCGVNWTELAGR
ncbi:MAG: hypothetical protein JW940_26005 [Polyangiaceae bacterium]|nr:hypothetical protein [Polyangiaceae bacterium]